MTNHDLLYVWCWTNQSINNQESISIESLSNRLSEARDSLVITGNNGYRIKDSGWNYAILKFLLKYCELPNEISSAFKNASRISQYGIWKKEPYINHETIVRKPNSALPSLTDSEFDDEPRIFNEEQITPQSQEIINNSNTSITWKKFYLFSEAVEYSDDKPTIYMQVSKTGQILRIGKASMGLGNRYNGGYQRTLDAAMWESGNSIYITKTSELLVNDIEANLIEENEPILNRQKPNSNKYLIINHENILIEFSRVVDYKHTKTSI